MYRDRVAERKKGLNIDYAQTETMNNVSAEHSKYLGGDLKHTHLVKGLDFALLKKVRDEMRDKLTDSKGSGNSGKKKLESELVFLSHKASSLYRELKRSRKTKIKTFMEGRTSIVFNLDDDEEDEEEKPPKLVSHGKRVGSSRDKERKEEQHVYCTVSDKLLSRLKKSRQSSSSRRKRELQKTSYLSSRSDDMDFEIFPGIGKYVPGS